MSDNETTEEVLWHGNPSQIYNVPLYICCLFSSPLIFPIFFGWWKFIELRCIEYEITTERIFKTTGVFSKTVNEVELYRVKDYTMDQPFWLRLFDLAHVNISSSDKNLPELTLKALGNADNLRDNIRSYVEQLRETKKIREVDGL